MYDPERYDNFNSLAGDGISQFVPQLIQRMCWTEGETILDFGCGAGTTAAKYFLPLAKLYNSKIEGIDISKVMVEYAQKKYVHPQIQFYHADIMDKNSPVNSKIFHKIFAIHVFHYIVNDASTIFKRLFKILLPGGEFALTVVSSFAVLDFVEDVVCNSKWSCFMKSTTSPFPPWHGTRSEECAEQSLRSGLEQAGFVISEIRTEKVTYSSDLETLTQFFISLTPFATNVPTELLDDLMEDYRGALRKLNDSKDDLRSTSEIQLHYCAVICLASKPLV